MKIKWILLFFAFTLLLSAFLLSVALQKSPDVRLDTVAINDTVKTLAKQWTDIQQRGDRLPTLENALDYAVIDSEGNLVAATRRGLSESINSAIQNRDTIVDIESDGKILGKTIFYNDTIRILEQNKTHLIRVFILMFAVLAIGFAGYALYLHFTLIRPFHKMKDFACHIAAGNFDLPLEMDKNNLFGAFTESFDLMREELRHAKENERKAEQSKKELVASLSHDIKTPVASIKAVTELMLVMAENQEDRKQLEIISAKAEQINVLITDMFHATLEELQVLNVTAAEVQSTAIPALIRNSDYKGLVKPFSIPNCLVSADLLRLEQVFDNIISNSYKYAGTDIEISAAFEGQYLAVTITDFGAGVPNEELPLLLNKFYRGKGTNTQNGYGLGLYISKHLMEQMSGRISCENCANGFAVRVGLRLA